MTKNKVTIQLAGGLANNLFQIATAYAYSIKNNFDLLLLNNKIGITHNQLNTYKDNILSKINLYDYENTSNYKIYNEPSFTYNEIPKESSNLILNGYFQSEKYFKEFRKEILDLFSYPEDYVNYIISKNQEVLSLNTCSIHVRRGDYLIYQNLHPVQSMSYYLKAIKQMPKNSFFLIFSDDINWCKENFPNLPEKFKFIENNRDYEDLLLMSLCKNNIICNSSFSWWGSWLNRNLTKIIIAPSAWFGASNSHLNTNDLYCDNWIRI